MRRAIKQKVSVRARGQTLLFHRGANHGPSLVMLLIYRHRWTETIYGKARVRHGNRTESQCGGVGSDDGGRLPNDIGSDKRPRDRRRKNKPAKRKG
jgi:hypothetical protein